MVEVQDEIPALEERSEDFDHFGYNLMDCSSCLLVKMGEKANYSGIQETLGQILPKIIFVQGFPANIVETYKKALTINKIMSFIYVK